MSRKKNTRRAGYFGEQQRDGHQNKVGSCSLAPTQSDYNRSSRVYSSEEIERGKRTLYRAELWRNNNPQAWALIVSHALNLAAKRQPIAAQSLIEAVRQKAFVDRFGNDTRTNNDFRSVFARWLIIEHPETAQYIEIRCSVFDTLIGGRND